jgi:ankyrin repeat protein
VDAINDAYTPLLAACVGPDTTKGKKDLFSLLLQYGANLTHKNNDSRTALDLAFLTGN